MLAGCATAGDGGSGGATAPSIDVTGTWNGAYTAVGSTGSNLAFVAALEQKGNVVTGTISGSSATSYNGPIHGTVNGNTFSWRQAMGTGSGHVTMNANGNEMSGTGTVLYTGRVMLRRAQ